MGLRGSSIGTATSSSILKLALVNLDEPGIKK
jgi:hypothetical protein